MGLNTKPFNVTLNERQFIRLYNAKGEHLCSILPCGVDPDRIPNCYDIALPDGRVIGCGVQPWEIQALAECGFDLVEE